jgi:hypothetical protein
MKIRSLVSLFALVLGVATTGALAAHEEHGKEKAADHSGHQMKGQLVKVDAKTDAAWLAKATAEYPTNICVVSNDKLGGDMGLPQDYIYRVEGKPDRLVRFCCKDCLKDFNEDSAKYLGLIDAAAAKKKAGK